MDCDERIQLDLDVDAHAACVGSGERVLPVTFHPVVLTESPSKMSTLTNAFQMLVKDKDIIASEVMHEYDEKVDCLLDSQYLSLTCDPVRLPSNQSYQERCSRHDAPS